MPRLVVTEPAKHDIQDAFQWWRDNRSTEQAGRWYRGIYSAIDALRMHPERCSRAAETGLLLQGLRQILFGIGRRPTHRIIFTLADDVVTVLRVRHLSQDVLRMEDVT